MRTVLLRLFILFTIVPLLEVYLLFALGRALGFGPTVAIVLVTGMLGAWLGRREGRRAWTQWQAALAEGRMPEDGIIGGLLVLVGGVLLVTPGVITDALGLSLLVPVSRRWVAARIRGWLEARVQDGSMRVQVMEMTPQGPRVRTAGGSPGVVDTVGELVEDEPAQLRSESST